MTNIVIKIDSVEPYPGDESEALLNGSCFYGKQSSDWVPFTIYFDRSALASSINTAIKDAAVSACAGVSITVGALDKKTLIGGAVGL